MNTYRIKLYDRYGNLTDDHIDANSSQEAADLIREEYKECCILWIAQKMHDWK